MVTAAPADAVVWDTARTGARTTHSAEKGTRTMPSVAAAFQSMPRPSVAARDFLFASHERKGARDFRHGEEEPFGDRLRDLLDGAAVARAVTVLQTHSAFR